MLRRILPPWVTLRYSLQQTFTPIFLRKYRPRHRRRSPLPCP
nr:MAG TPA: hypothetical protein [Caudoviricetes sp.]